MTISSTTTVDRQPLITLFRKICLSIVLRQSHSSCCRCKSRQRSSWLRQQSLAPTSRCLRPARARQPEHTNRPIRSLTIRRRAKSRRHCPTAGKNFCHRLRPATLRGGEGSCPCAILYSAQSPRDRDCHGTVRACLRSESVARTRLRLLRQSRRESCRCKGGVLCGRSPSSQFHPRSPDHHRPSPLCRRGEPKERSCFG